MELEEPPSCGRDWSELQRDVLVLIFLKLGTMQVLTTAGSVCRTWRKVAKEEPELWRRIDITNLAYDCDCYALKDLTKLAIDRSGGRLEEFSVEKIGDDDLLRYLCDRTSTLKKLCLISCYQLSEEAIVETGERQPLLEEIHITFAPFSETLTEIVGKQCPQLKSFKLNTSWHGKGTTYLSDEEEDNDDALGIAKNMHQLHHLQLIGNRLTNEGLKAILDGCPYLETLDIRHCYNVNMDPDMRPRCAKLKTIRLPNDSLDDVDNISDDYEETYSDYPFVDNISDDYEETYSDYPFVDDDEDGFEF
ncbi:hypothetical protein LUZ61_002288 [Rhynchospora tenuis]|uniref:F-box domain-containing protein n=1 Tax=Rhynchospora tenuis TaxID=198213 RepID=A0AAD5ZIN1_9POAL|nr:hypothetical protein LUZ61_002288 [Rhynchospora tenuis]